MLDDLRGTSRALPGLDRRHRDTAMPGRTLTQYAVPITFGLKAARLAVRGARRRDAVGARGLPVQLGGAAGTLAPAVELAR